MYWDDDVSQGGRLGPGVAGQVYVRGGSVLDGDNNDNRKKRNDTTANKKAHI